MIQKYYRRREVEALTGLSRSSIYALMQREEFPRPHRITSKAVAWPESAIAEWMVTRPTAA